MTPKKSLVLLSGGLDSAANLAFCKKTDTLSLAITIDYGQRAAANEIESAKALCAFFNVPHEIIRFDFFKNLGSSALTSSLQMPHLKSTELDDAKATTESAKGVWVPNRNGVFLSVAAAIAEAKGLEQVVVGFNREEAATFMDNTEHFAKAFSESLTYSTQNKVRVHCYTFDLDKSQIVQKLRQEVPEFPFSKTWSCYEAGREPCRKCESCLRSLRAMENAV